MFEMLYAYELDLNCLNLSLTCMLTSPPGANKKILEKLMYLMLRRVSINETPVSLAPTTTILLLLLFLLTLSIFLVIRLNANWASSSSSGLRFLSWLGIGFLDFSI